MLQRTGMMGAFEGLGLGWCRLLNQTQTLWQESLASCSRICQVACQVVYRGAVAPVQEVAPKPTTWRGVMRQAGNLVQWGTYLRGCCSDDGTCMCVAMQPMTAGSTSPSLLCQCKRGQAGCLQQSTRSTLSVQKRPCWVLAQELTAGCTCALAGGQTSACSMCAARAAAAATSREHTMQPQGKLLTRCHSGLPSRSSMGRNER